MNKKCQLNTKVQCDECPWRTDVAPGRFPPEGFILLRSSVEQGFNPMFACHKTPEGNEKACVGYLASPESLNNFVVRLGLMRGQLDIEGLKLKGPSYESYAAMAAANGVDS